MALSALSPGTMLAGYRIERVLGRGGMGLVYRATDPKLERPVAIKLIAPEFARDEVFRERFLRESRLAASLGHPHVLPVYAAGEDDGQLYLAMRFVEGEDLRSLLDRERALEPTRALRILAQVAEALDTAHAKGLVHRDVKPANVLLDERGEAYLADFGLTKQVGGASTETGRLVGTLDYLAPEQIRGEKVDARTDCYSLACVLFECLAGAPPFGRRTEAETLWAHMQEESPPLLEYPVLDRVFAKALAKAKDERYASCGELIRASRQALGLEPAPPVPLPRRLASALRSQRWKLLVAAALVSAAAIAAVVLAVTRGGGSGPEPVANALASIDPTTGRVLSYTEVGTTPSAVRIGEGAVWVLNADDQTVSRIDPATGRITKTFGTGGTPTDVAVGEGWVWVGNGEPAPGGVPPVQYTASVSRIDPRSAAVTRRIPLPPPRKGDLPVAIPGVSQLAVGADSLWAINPDFTVSRIDPATADVVATVPVRATGGIAAEREGVWVVGDGSTVTRIDPRTNRPAQTIEVGATFLAGIAVGAGSVWASAPQDGLVWRIEPGPRAPGPSGTPPPLTRTFSAGLGTTSIAFADGVLWAANFVEETIARIDPKTNSVTQTVALAGTPQGMAPGEGLLWVTVAGETTRAALPASTCGKIESGGRQPDFLIASDLPLQGPSGPITQSMADAIRFVLGRNRFSAGRYAVGYQSCDDSTAQAGHADFFKCASNAKAYARAERLVGVIGPFNSGCAAVEVPIVNQAPTGALAVISPSNTYVGLTRGGPGTERGEPAAHYPTGTRNYFRVIAHDGLQGAALAMLARQLDVERVYVLHDGQGYGAGLAHGFVTAAGRLGVEIAGSRGWDPEAGSYAAVADRVARSGAEGVFLSGLVFLNGGEVVKALRKRLGGKVVLMAGDGFMPVPELLDLAGAAAHSMYVSATTAQPGLLGATGRQFAEEFAASQPDGPLPPHVAETAQAAEVLLAAIARSDGTRISIVEELQAIEVEQGILGSFRFDANGDRTPGTISIYKITGKTPPGDDLEPGLQGAVADRAIRVPANLLP